MMTDLTPFTRELEACRKRWNKRSLMYVLRIAAILRRARKAAKEERHWTRWIKNEIHFARATVYRYLRVAEFVRRNVSVRRHFDELGLPKVYALSRLQPSQVAAFLRNGRAALLSESELNQQVRVVAPPSHARPTITNLVKSLDAALNRVERCMNRWQMSRQFVPPQTQARLVSKLRALSHAVMQLKNAKPLAM